jgi:formamidopyrimidine-DNA glycosylase
VAHRTDKLKPLLMDQSFIVGLGDVYTDEILYDAGLRPDREVSTLSTMEIRRLYRSLVEILHEATKHHGTSVDGHPFVDLNGKAGSFQEELQVWGRAGEACRRCRGTVGKSRSGGRTTFACPSCQV